MAQDHQVVQCSVVWCSLLILVPISNCKALVKLLACLRWFISCLWERSCRRKVLFGGPSKAVQRRRRMAGKQSIQTASLPDITRQLSHHTETGRGRFESKLYVAHCKWWVNFAHRAWCRYRCCQHARTNQLLPDITVRLLWKRSLVASEKPTPSFLGLFVTILV